ncbi:hypothetical protein BLOT_015851 [Blomia tropicalis]|nr:hypothetical protein BLOT_016686 [Blomia tropicalis]KAI2796297.1 hypothetical protein BLOT_015851 [Blomia tropicalis]
MQHDFIFNTNKMMIALFYIKNCNQISSNDVDYDYRSEFMIEKLHILFRFPLSMDNEFKFIAIVNKNKDNS